MAPTQFDDQQPIEAWSELLVPAIRQVVDSGTRQGLPLEILAGVILSTGEQVALEIGFSRAQVIELLQAQIEALREGAEGPHT